MGIFQLYGQYVNFLHFQITLSQVKKGHYGFRHSWSGLEIDTSFLLKTSTGRSVLCIEADATNADEALDFGNKSEDLCLEVGYSVTSTVLTMP